jgi:hypothetical protein
MPKPSAFPFVEISSKCNGFDLKVTTRRTDQGVSEVCGFVDEEQVFGIYVDDPQAIRSSLAQCPSGEIKKVQAIVKCMSLVVQVVDVHFRPKASSISA